MSKACCAIGAVQKAAGLNVEVIGILQFIIVLRSAGEVVAFKAVDGSKAGFFFKERDEVGIVADGIQKKRDALCG